MRRHLSTAVCALALAGPMAGAAAADLGLPSATPGNFICQPDGAALGAQERFIDASTVDELERKAREQLGAAFKSAAANCMTVAQRRLEGKRLAGQRLIDADGKQGRAPAGTLAACHAARQSCATRCTAETLARPRPDDAAAARCSDACVTSAVQCQQRATK